MSLFLKPGDKQNKTFGTSFSDVNVEVEPVYFNKNENLVLSEQRRSLPIYKQREVIQYLVDKHQTTIIVGETGSGKTTQIPQYLFEIGWAQHGYQIVCTQPRRIAAVSVTSRVCDEMDCRVGDIVGYTVRFEDVTNAKRTRIKYVTDGILLQEIMADPLLKKYSVVMIDEAHERSLASDILLGLLKKVQKQRPDLRLIVSSATLDAEQLQRFFDNRPKSEEGPSRKKQKTSRWDTLRNDQQYLYPQILSVEGRQHHVTVHYLNQATRDYIKTAVEVVLGIHKLGGPGDILVFLTGYEDCNKATKILRDFQASNRSLDNLYVQPLYAGLQTLDQLAALQPSRKGFRKVVMATNVAETSLTIEGIIYVADSMFVKQRWFNSSLAIDELVTVPISKASAIQRAGRAGRLATGHCFRLCREEDYEKLERKSTPEIQRSELSQTILQLKALGIDNILDFKFLSKPSAKNLASGLQLLYALGAIDDQVQLTQPLGKQMSEISLTPMQGKCLLASIEFDCVEEMTTILGFMSAGNIWSSANGQIKLHAAKKQFGVHEGDQITYLNIWKSWHENNRSGQWSSSHCLNQRSLLKASSIKQQLWKKLQTFGHQKVSSAAENIEKIQKALVGGMFYNAAQYSETDYGLDARTSENGVHIYKQIRQGDLQQKGNIRIHPNSVLYDMKPKWICFAAGQRVNKNEWLEVWDICECKRSWLLELAPHIYADIPQHRQVF